ncbi:ABC transporter ATP-binding protein [Mycoplasmopsis cricetuli]|uniref:ABC transporter ATP-binding protein n=1 Tax=Mycoplasmopsis cricetuli TaxID=171283 RepID=UPI000471A22E|nr:ABC transporter ATP-binding protein [Mycoplasmopsis cricetuli]
MILKVKNISKKYISNKHAFELSNVSFSLQNGKILGLIGKSGSGKTTIGKIITRLIDDYEGEIIIDGITYSKLKPTKQNLKRLRQNTQIIFQNPIDSLNNFELIYQTLKLPILTFKTYKSKLNQINNFLQKDTYQDFIFKKNGFCYFLLNELDFNQLNLSCKIDVLIKNLNIFNKQIQNNLNNYFKINFLENSNEYQTEKKIKKLFKLKNKLKKTIIKKKFLAITKIQKENLNLLIKEYKKLKTYIKLMKTEMHLKGISNWDFWKFKFQKYLLFQKIILKIKRYFLKQIIIDQLISSALKEVGLNENWVNRYPFQFSGGQQQRISIARALLANPKLIIADEPISSLDISIQAQIVNLLKDLCNQKNIAILFIAHDLNMVRFISDDVIVLYQGQIVEQGTVFEIFENPIHPYTKSLLLSSLTHTNDLKNFNFEKTQNSKYIKISKTHFVLDNFK